MVGIGCPIFLYILKFCACTTQPFLTRITGINLFFSFILDLKNFQLILHLRFDFFQDETEYHKYFDF